MHFRKPSPAESTSLAGGSVCWLLRGAHRAGPAHALSDLSKLCASLLFLGSALPLSRGRPVAPAC